MSNMLDFRVSFCLFSSAQIARSQFPSVPSAFMAAHDEAAPAVVEEESEPIKHAVLKDGARIQSRGDELARRDD